MRVKDAAKKRELVAFLLEEEGIKLAPAERITRRTVGDRAPLSFAQQRLWFLNEFAGGSSAYNISLALLVHGRLDAVVFERALNEIVRRHEVLRTTFTSAAGMAEQIIHPSLHLDVPLIDLGSLSEQERLVEVEKMARKEAEDPFDLRTGPLIRVKLVFFNEHEHVMLLTLHHITSDAWSVTRFFRELRTNYKAFLNGKPSAYPELPIQYADFAIWQRNWLQGDVLEKQLEFWRTYLAGAPSLLEMPTDRPRAPVQTFAGKVESLQVSTRNLEALKALSQREGVTLFMTLLAAFKVLLHRYTAQTDIVVGTPVAGRNRSETDQLIGFFVNTLAVRTDLSGDPTFTEVLKRVREVCLNAFAHQDLPFEKLVDELQPERNLSHTPIFQVAFSLQHEVGGAKVELPVEGNNGAGALEEGDFTLDLMEVENGTAKFDLSLFMSDSTEGGLCGTFEYNTDLFDASSIHRLVLHFLALLESVVVLPDLPISRLPILSESEIKQQLVEWNETERDYPQRLLPELVQTQAERTPEAIALVFEDTQLSYAELNGRANQLGHFLRARGVGPETRVGILMHRSIELVVSLLAVVKAGGAYVPLDPEYPQERLSFMLEDSQAQVLLTQERLLAEMSWCRGVAAETIAVDDQRWAAVLNESDCATPPEMGPLTPDNLAYVIYTSGSTGRPKGAMNTHRGIVNRLLWMQEKYQLQPSDCVMQKTPFSFDVSVWEFFWPLLSGARLVLARPGGHRDTAYLAELIDRAGVTTLHFVPTMLQVFLEEPTPLRSQSLRQVMCSGEALSVELVKRFQERLSGVELHNLYGPTEAAVDVSYFGCVAGSELRSIPIGRPVANTQLYVLDAGLQPLPVGVSGELYIGGVQLARGYWRRAGLTGERFVPDPYAAAAGQRMYRTGDLARYLASGEIEYLGRVDQQVKLRGFRIELGEIETALMAHTDVRDAVAIMRGGRSEDNGQLAQLVGYYTVDGAGEKISGSELRQYLKTRLPDYMVPSMLVQLEQMPLTPSGKIDRKALPAPEFERVEIGAVYKAPRNAVEVVLVSIWSEILKAPEVGVNDNFFALGGDSIRSLQVVGLARERGLNVSLQQMLQHQTIRELAAELQRQEPDGTVASEVTPFSMLSEADRANLPVDLEDAYQLSMLQAGMLYHMRAMAGASLYHNVNSMHLRARFDERALREAVQRVVRRHEALRTSFDLSGYSEPLQLVHRDAEMEIRLEDLQGLSDAEQERAIDEYMKAERYRGFDLARAPLLRFAVHVRDEQRFQLTLTECHAIQDGWSLHTTLAEIFDGYFALLRGEELRELDQLEVKYREFVHLEREVMRSEEQHRFWQDKLDGSTLMELLRGPHANEGSEPQVLMKVFDIPAVVSDGLHRLAREAAVPIKSVLLSAHVKVMSMLSGKTDIVTGVSTNGRPEKKDGEKVVGLFLNFIPFRRRLSSGTWIDLARETFKDEQEILPYRRYPMAALQNSRGRQRLFEAGFNYVHFHAVDGVLQSGEVEVLDFKIFEATSLTLQAHFNRGLLNSRIGLTLEYDSVRLSEEQIQRIGGYYLNVLQAMAREPSARHDAHSYLLPEEERLLLHDWNDTHTEQGAVVFVHEEFERQATSTPLAVAVVYNDERLTFAELNEHANQIAHFLRRIGVGAESHVGICLERSPLVLAGLLGILKAGAAYVPLDAEGPPERFAFMVKDAQVEVLLTQERLLAAVPDELSQVICLDGDWELIAECETTNPGISIDGDNLAYVIYTSGSTGRPKGTMITHRGLSNYLRWAIAAYRLHEGQGSVLHSAISFDLSVTSVFTPLLTGTQLLLVPESLGIEGLSDTLDAGPNFGLLKLTPAHIDTLRQRLDPQRLRDVTRALIIGGEALFGESLAFWREHAPPTRIINEYGPTETVVGCCVYEIPAGDVTPGPVPIGRPINNTRLYVLDRALQPVPVGVAGELFIGGVQLARGYLRRSGLTAERFVPDLYSSEPGQRLYRTGDLVRYLPDGNLMFVGRRDQQVKMRGYRIELGEIEAALDSHPAVEQSAVLVNEQGPGDKQLVAYIVAQSHQAFATEAGEISDLTAVQMDEVLRFEMRGHLRARLPEYMIPATFLQLPRMPLTVGGKVDRKALAGLNAEHTRSDRVWVPPSSDVERVMADTWSEILRVPQIGIHDNFFELGGDSIRGMQVVAKLNQAQLRLTSTQLFEHPTIAELATLVQVNGEKQQTVAREEEISGDVPLTPIQHWFFSQPPPDPHHFNQALTFEVPPRLDANALAGALTCVIEHHDALRLRFTRENGVWRQVNAPVGEPVAFERFDLSALPFSEQLAAMKEKATQLQASLNLSEGPMLRAAYFDLGAEQKGRLVLIIHHLCVDGVSWRVLLEDLRTGYEQLRQGEEVTLPAKTTSFKRWAGRLQDYAQSEELKSEAAYWVQAVPKVVSRLPIDYPAGANTVANEQHVTTRLEAEQTHALLREVPKGLRVEINEVLLTALAQAFGKWSGGWRLLVDVEGHGREALFEDVDVSRTVGWFTSIYPVLLDTPGNRDSGALLKRVKERQRAVPRRGVGYGLLRYLREDDEIAEQLRQKPAAQILFNYLGQFDDAATEDSPFAPARESSGPTQSPEGERRYLFEVNGSVERGELHMVWTYSGAMYKRATVEQLADDYLSALRELVMLARGGEGAALTAADFPKAKLKQEHLDKLLTKLKRA